MKKSIVEFKSENGVNTGILKNVLLSQNNIVYLSLNMLINYYEACRKRVILKIPFWNLFTINFHIY